MGILAIKRDDNSYEGEEKEKNEALKRKRRLWKDKCKHIGDGVVMVVGQREVSKMTPKLLVCPNR